MIVEKHPKIEVFQEQNTKNCRWRWRFVDADGNAMVESIEYLSVKYALEQAQKLPKINLLVITSHWAVHGWIMRVEHVDSELPVAYGVVRYSEEYKCSNDALFVNKWLEKRIKIEVLT